MIITTIYKIFLSEESILVAYTFKKQAALTLINKEFENAYVYYCAI
jgi:hypothetical protein